MTELDIIKELFKSFSNHSQIVLHMQDGSSFSGTIQFFDGETITMEGRQLSLPSISSVEPCFDEVKEVVEETATQANIQEYKGHWVDIVCNKDGNQKELSGFLFDIRNGLIALITKTEKVIIHSEDIVSIARASSYQQEALPSPRTEGKESAFEKALLDGNREIAERFLGNLETLKEQGYSDDEIGYIQKRVKAPVPWVDDDKNRQYNQARRIFEFEGNRHQLVSSLLKQFLNSGVGKEKTRVKAFSLLVDILAEEQPTDLLPFFAQYEDLIRSNGFISLKVATAFVQAGEYKKARSLIDENRKDVDYSELLFSLRFFEEHPDYDFSHLPGVDAFENNTGYKEFAYLIQLPNKSAFTQLLSLYSNKGRISTFFSLLELFMPYARTDSRVVSLTGECLLKEGAEPYIKQYLPLFPTLWLNKSLTTKYLETSEQNTSGNDTLSHLMNQCKRTAIYATPNELEEAVIKGNYELFEVLRGNNSILLSLGYSSAEIDQIRDVDADLIRYGNKTTVEKLTRLEGNRNHVPESVAGKDFLSAPREVGEILFPILIDADCGDLVYELFNYSPFIHSQLSGLDKFYFKALLLLNKGEELWEQIKDSWLSLNLDSEVLSVAQRVAYEKGNNEVALAMEIYADKAPLNELENALILGNIAKLRPLVTDADYLTDNGYSVEEIKLLQESMKRPIDTSKSDNLSIANRVYTFQKNKNRTAELYYTLALEDSGSLAASGLFSIYASENRNRELCRIYEQYLLNDPVSDIAENRELYLLALFETEEYERFYSLWKLVHSDICVDPVIALNVLIRVSAPDSEIEELLKAPIKVDILNKACAKDCLMMLCHKELTATTVSWITRLFNSFFLVCGKDDAQVVRESLVNQSQDFSAPDGNGLTLLFQRERDYELVKAWIAYLFKIYPSSEEQILILGNTIDIFDDGSLAFGDIIRAFLKDLLSQGIAVPEEYKEFLKPVFKDNDEKSNWLREKLRDPLHIDEWDFDLFISLAEELDNTLLLEQLLSSLSVQDLKYNSTYIATVLDLIGNPTEHKISTDTADMLLRCISPRLATGKLSADGLAMLFKAYLFTEDYDSAFLVHYVITEGGVVNAEDGMLETLSLPENRLSLFEVVRKSLVRDISSIDELASVFGQYLKINESDAAGLDTIKDYYNSPSKWDRHALDSLAKLTLSKPSTILYWRLMDAYFTEDCPEKYCIRYHLAKLDKTALEPVIIGAAQHNLSNQTVSLLHAAFSESSADSFEKSFDTVNFVVANHNAWLSDETTATNLITAIHDNNNLRKVTQIWNNAVNLAMDIAFYGHAEKTFYALFGEDLRSDLEISHEKFLCRLILNQPDQTELISSIVSSIRDSAIDTPFKEIISEIAPKAVNGTLTPVQQGLLEIVIDNDGSSRDDNTVYRYYLQSIIEGNEETALLVVDQLALFYPEWLVIPDIKKYELLSGKVEDPDVLKLYDTACSDIKTIPNEKRLFKSIINALPGELYLQAKGYEIELVSEYGVKTLPSETARRLREQVDLYKSLANIFDEERYPNLLMIFLRCLFLRKWEDFINYNPADKSINRITEADETISKLLFTKTYEIFKCALLCVLNAESDNADVVDRADSIMAATAGMNRSKDCLHSISTLDKETSLALQKVLKLRIESPTLRRDGLIGPVILQIPENEKIAYLFGMLSHPKLSDIFDKNEVMDALLRMPQDRAVTIANAYLPLFTPGTSNAFTKYLSIQSTSDDLITALQTKYAFSEDKCKPFRESYLAQKDKLDRIDSETPQQIKTQQIKRYSYSRTEYLFRAIINDSAEDVGILQPSCMDYLSVLVFLFNRQTIADMKEYLWHVDNCCLEPSLAVILSLLEQYASADGVAAQIEDSAWKDSAYQIICKSMSAQSKYAPLTSEEADLMRRIQSQIQINKAYAIGKSVPYNAEQIPTYIQKMEALRLFLDEALSYIADKGLDMSSVLFDKERYDLAINRYAAPVEKDSEESNDKEIAEPVTVDENPLTLPLQISGKEKCKSFRENYLAVKNRLYRNGSSNQQLKKTLSYSKTEYLFHAIINSSAEDVGILQPSCMDYLSVVVFLFNRQTTADMKEYLWHVDNCCLEPSLAVILCLLEQYVSADGVAAQIKDSVWKDAVYQIICKSLYAQSKNTSLTSEEADLMRSIQSQIQIKKTYTIGKFVPYTAEQVPTYIQKMEALREFLDEVLSYIANKGIDVSSVMFDKERYDLALNRYVTSGERSSEENSQEIASPVTADKKPIKASLFIDVKEVYRLIEGYPDISAISHSDRHTPGFKDCIGELKFLIASKENSQDKRDVLRIRDLLRWTYIRLMEEAGFSREYFNKTLGLLSKDDSISKAQWSAVITSLNQYFDDATSIQKLSRIVENDITYLKNISNVSNTNIRLMSRQDIGAWEAIIFGLEDLAGINTATMSERDLLSKLSAIRSQLLTAQEKSKGTVFAQPFRVLLTLLTKEITELRHTPELSISIPEEKEDGISILWESENTRGTLYAVISNTGGADCENVTLISRINMKSVRHYRIKTIYAGEMIPFKAVFHSDDVVNGRLTWDLEASYYDTDKGQPVSLLHETTVTVKKGGEPIKIGKISTGNPATGKDFVGRRRELSLLQSHYSDEQQLPSMLIRGLKRSGKSSLIIKLAEELRKQDRFLVALVDGQSIGGNIKNAFVNKVLDNLRISYRSSKTYQEVMDGPFNDFQNLWQEKMDSLGWIGNLDIFFYELSQLFKRKILIIIDEMESIFYNHRFNSVDQEDSLYAALRALIQNPGNYVSFLFCGSDMLLTSCLEQRRESQMFQTLQFLEVGRMNNGDIKEVFRKQSAKYDVEFTADAVDAIWQYTHGLVWYAKLIGYLIINNILSNDLTIRKEVNRSDVATAVQMLINGEIGTDKYDLVDASLNTFRSSLVHAMASIMPDYNKEVSIDEIAAAMIMLQMEGYKNPRNGEPVPSFDEKQLVSNLEFLEKMQFLDANASRTKYAFTADLYRLFFRNDKKLHLFEERSV